MSLRFRKSIPLGKFARINLTKTGIGLSAGVPGARASIHSSGRVTTSAGLPGTGISWRKDSRIKSARSEAPAWHHRPRSVKEVNDSPLQVTEMDLSYIDWSKETVDLGEVLAACDDWTDEERMQIGLLLDSKVAYYNARNGR